MDKKTELKIWRMASEKGWSYEEALTWFIQDKCTHGELVRLYIQLWRDYDLEVEE
tara:strand:- start:425 stop:589 length:165 start_codon:yes stop_codon:yes gene_type:complete